jgi:hypothetical protein
MVCVIMTKFNQFQCWYPAKAVRSEGLPGIKISKRDLVIIPDTPGHILLNKVPMCHISLEAEKSKYKAAGGVIRSGALLSHAICPDCEEIYKTREDLPWNKWVNG